MTTPFVKPPVECTESGKNQGKTQMTHKIGIPRSIAPIHPRFYAYFFNSTQWR